MGEKRNLNFLDQTELDQIKPKSSFSIDFILGHSGSKRSRTDMKEESPTPPPASPLASTLPDRTDSPTSTPTSTTTSPPPPKFPLWTQCQRDARRCRRPYRWSKGQLLFLPKLNISSLLLEKIHSFHCPSSASAINFVRTSTTL